MRWVLIILLAVGACFIGLLLFWPQTPATSQSDYRPQPPDWLMRFMPNPPAALPSASTLPPAELASGASWTGSFTARNRELGVVRFRLISGVALKITAQERGEEDQFLCVLAAGAAPPSKCNGYKISDGPKAGVIVRKGTASIQIEAPSGAVTFRVNE
jgi:hypothetical protein